MKKRVRIFDFEVDALTRTEAVGLLNRWLNKDEYMARYVVTPNVNHIVKLQNDAKFQQAYRHADLVLADGKPIVLASRLFGKALPETVPGSDLVPLFFNSSSVKRPLSIFLLGAASGVAKIAKYKIEKKWPSITVVGLYSPRLGFENNADELILINEKISKCSPDMVIVGLGAPKQEVWAFENREEIRAKVVLCVGATIDFLAGHRKRAPALVTKFGFEWLFRAACEPRRLMYRYMCDMIIFPKILLAEWKKERADKC